MPTLFKNETPHAISIRTADGGSLTLPASDSPPRLATHRQDLASMGGVVFRKTTLGAPDGLPHEEEGVIRVVSALVAEHPALAGRTDLAYPGEPLRDASGRIVGCNGLCAGPGLARKLRRGGGYPCGLGTNGLCAGPGLARKLEGVAL